jgi:hypothetical protein
MAIWVAKSLFTGEAGRPDKGCDVFHLHAAKAVRRHCVETIAWKPSIFVWPAPSAPPGVRGFACSAESVDCGSAGMPFALMLVAPSEGCGSACAAGGRTEGRRPPASAPTGNADDGAGAAAPRALEAVKAMEAASATTNILSEAFANMIVSFFQEPMRLLNVGRRQTTKGSWLRELYLRSMRGHSASFATLRESGIWGQDANFRISARRSFHFASRAADRPWSATACGQRWRCALETLRWA